MKREKGSIAIFVLVALLFMSAFLIISFASNVNKSKTVKEQFNIISGIYAYANGEEGAYDKAYADLRNKNKQTMTASSENSAILELTNTFNENMSNYRIYGSGGVQKLPEEYQEVEYIESTGTQYIDTGFKPNNSTNIDLRMELPSSLTATGGALLGVQDSSVKYAIVRAFAHGKDIDYFGIFTEKSTSSPALLAINKDVIYNYVLKDNKVYINGELKYTETNAIEHQFEINLYLFARNNNGTASGNDSRRLYSAKIYDNETLVRDFVPCYRKSDNAIGLYDLVNNVFYINEGTGTFNKGNAVIENVGDIVTDATNANYGNYKIPIKVSTSSLLPKGYQEVEYIESTGTQYIDTGFKPNNSMNIELIVELPSSLTATGGALLGVQDDSVKYAIARTIENGKNLEYFGIFLGKSVSRSALLEIKKDVIYNYVLKDNKVYINGELKYTETNSIEHQFDINLYLLARNNNGTASDYDARRLYSAKIYDNETLVRYFVPCYRKSDNAIGMYDVVNNVFYTNAGTGTFNKCSDEIGEGEITNIYLDEPLRKIRDSADYIDFKTGKVVRYVGKIDSYNGETITTSWISSTGELSTGATVYYVLDTPIEETVTLPQLKSYEDYTKIEVLTSITPSRIEVEYMGYTLE